ncbi:hypothetical protein G1K46_12535 [Tenacibaculum finnmarkense]|uniref:hypothetical protein n=1 Tax=Tenacibaculum finnmarkense TaxID=2781243 RepID=UPI001EFB0FD4|nr:hypothetical protein [Tenacibaculum finnmarkense]MCG8763543.1 hypothetical protein [Tenacibaculum finnmarkense]MCG8788919.1 hypothetical protein [Tenacibaculum finnmarkense]
MNKWKLTINGTGKLGNSSKMINEVFEIDENTLRNVSNSNSKEQVIKSLLLNRLPGIEFDVNKLGINKEEIRKPIIKKETLKDLGKSTIAGAIGGAILNKASNHKKNRKVEYFKEDEEEIINSFAHELVGFHNISFNDNLVDTKNKLDEIYYGIKSYKWKYASEGINKTTISENNRSLSKCLSKFEHGFNILSNINEDENIKKDYGKKYKKLRLKKVIDKFGKAIGIIILLLLAFLILSILD